MGFTCLFKQVSDIGERWSSSLEAQHGSRTTSPSEGKTIFSPIKIEVLAVPGLGGFTHGFPWHKGPKYLRVSGNNKSALSAASVVVCKQDREISLGRTAGPFQEPPLPDFHSPPWG